MGYGIELGIDALVKAYEDWKKTPVGKRYVKEEKTWIPIEIPKEQLPIGWSLEDGGMKEGYFVYEDRDGNQVRVEPSFDQIPVHLGGYPDHHSIEVSSLEILEVDPEEDDDRIEEDELQSSGKYSVPKFGWKKAFEMANELALRIMKDMI